MRHKRWLIRVIQLLGLGLYLSIGALAADVSRDKILATFSAYEALNADFLSSVEKGQGRSGKSYSALRKEAEAYAEGPFHNALNAAQTQVCRFKDIEILNALFHVTISTSNSADEAPAWTLGHIFVCQPDIVKTAFSALPPTKQQDLYKTLEFGFENAVYRKPKNDKMVDALRRKLHTMAPGGVQ